MSCPHCREQLTILPSSLGRDVVCPLCGALFLVRRSGPVLVALPKSAGKVPPPVPAPAAMPSEAPPADPGAPDAWYILTRKGEIGPIAPGKLFKAARRGKIARKTPIRHARTGKRVLADQLPVLERVFDLIEEGFGISTGKVNLEIGADGQYVGPGPAINDLDAPSPLAGWIKKAYDLQADASGAWLPGDNGKAPLPVPSGPADSSMVLPALPDEGRDAEDDFDRIGEYLAESLDEQPAPRPDRPLQINRKRPPLPPDDEIPSVEIGG